MFGPMGHDFIQIISVSGELRTAQISCSNHYSTYYNQKEHNS